jgi:hypothetical protein
MDLETAEALDSIRGDIRRIEIALSAESNELRQEIDELRQGILESVGAGRRRTEVLFESLRDDIRLVAEGLAAISAKVDHLTR